MTFHKFWQHERAGFTIVELLVVIVVIGILASITIISFGAWQQNAAASQMKSDLNGVGSAMENARNFSTGYPLCVTTPNSCAGFTPSTNVILSGGGSVDGTTYCVDATNNNYTSLTYYIDNLTQAPTAGTCAGRTNVPVPTAPTGLASSSNTDTTASFSWTSTSPYTVTYTLKCATDPGFTRDVQTTTATPPATSATISSLNQLTTYYCEIQAIDGAGSSGWSSSTSANTAETPLSAPTGLVTATASTTQINYAFNFLSGASSYKVQIGTVAGFGSGIVATNQQTGQTGSFSGLSPSTLYYLRIQAISSTGFAGTWSTGTVTGATYTNWSVYTKFAVVGDWNGDGKNDIIAYKPDGTVDLHLGGGNGTFGPAFTLTNIGTTVRDIIGPGTLPGGTAPILWWDNADGNGYALKSNGATGVSGSPINSGVSGWNTCTTAFAAPKFYTNGTVVVICEGSALTEYSLNSSAAATLVTTYGSGWSAAYGVNVFGMGDWSGDGVGDIGGNSAAGAITVYPGTGTGTTGTTFSGGTGWASNILTGGWDLNGDGHVDILRYNTSSGVLTYYPGSGSSGGAYPYFGNGGNPIVIN
jgi:prepilin-type N-terminal cleavage/methylation domain-containing protein